MCIGKHIKLARSGGKPAGLAKCPYADRIRYCGRDKRRRQWPAYNIRVKLKFWGCTYHRCITKGHISSRFERNYCLFIGK